MSRVVGFDTRCLALGRLGTTENIRDRCPESVHPTNFRHTVIPASLGVPIPACFGWIAKTRACERVDNLLDKAWRESCCKLRISSIECRPGENGSELGFARAGDWATVCWHCCLCLSEGWLRGRRCPPRLLPSCWMRWSPSHASREILRRPSSYLAAFERIPIENKSRRYELSVP